MTKGPDYTRGLIEPPQGEIKKKGYTLAFYTKEQMKRLNVDKFGKKLKDKKIKIKIEKENNFLKILIILILILLILFLIL